MAKENPAIKPRPKLTLGQWIFAIVGAAILLYGLHLAGIAYIPFFDNSNSGDTSTSSSSSTSNDDSQRFYSRNGVYSGSITFTADKVHDITYHDSDGSVYGSTEHISTIITFPQYAIGDNSIPGYEVPVSGTYDYSCAVTGNYKGSGKLSNSFSQSFESAPAPFINVNGQLKDGVSIYFSGGSGYGAKDGIGAEVACRAAGGPAFVTNKILVDIFTQIDGNTDKLASKTGYPTYFFEPDGGTVSFGRTYTDYNEDTWTYSGTMTLTRDK